LWKFGVWLENISNCSKGKDGIKTIEVRLKIKRRKDVYKFIKEIGFPNKKRNLNKLLNSLKLNGNL
jgi:hypothetical protein